MVLFLFFITFAFLMLGISKSEGEDFEDFMLEIMY